MLPMRYALACLLTLAGGSLATADAPTLAEARQRLLRGNYAEARELYATLAKEADKKIPATIGLSQALQAEGEYDKALAALDAAVKEAPKSADLLAARAELLHFCGRWDEAAKVATQALAISPEH